VVRAVFLDLDNTLVDRDGAFERWLRQYTSDAAMIAALTAADAGGARPRREFASELCARLGFLGDPDALAEGFPVALAAFVEPEPGVREALEHIHARCRIAVVSNGSSVGQRAKLARLGLDGVIDHVFISAELGLAKPDPELFRHVLQWAEADAADCAFVGDDPYLDLAPAAALGMITIWRERASWPAELAAPAFVIRTIPELVEVCA
jgi:putative hydrolase of the HAD superfamily